MSTEEVKEKLWFNRTFMELKSPSRIAQEEAKAGFNRTFMELKSMRQITERNAKVRFNRTFMELKLQTVQDHTSRTRV